jgi:ribosome maturation factor RimP
LDDCESVSQQISLILDVEDLISEDYTLEVSSPGLNRKLTKIEHYLRFLGSEVKIKLHPSIEGRKNYRGKLLVADEDEIEIEVDGQMHRIATDTIDNTRLVPTI